MRYTSFTGFAGITRRQMRLAAEQSGGQFTEEEVFLGDDPEGEEGLNSTPPSDRERRGPILPRDEVHELVPDISS